MFESVIRTLTDHHFPLVRVHKQSTEAPWITKRIRKLWKRKIPLYKRGGKSQQWHATNRELQGKIAEARSGFVDLLLEEGNSGKTFYAAPKKLSTKAQAPQWTVNDLFPGQDPQAVTTEVLEYYGNISNQPTRPVPVVEQVCCGPSDFTLERTTRLLKGAKKTESRVDGDPLAHHVRRFSGAFAVPVAEIFNEVNRIGQWPANWKTEHLTIIPKVPNP